MAKVKLWSGISASRRRRIKRAILREYRESAAFTKELQAKSSEWAGLQAETKRRDEEAEVAIVYTHAKLLRRVEETCAWLERDIQQCERKRTSRGRVLGVSGLSLILLPLVGLLPHGAAVVIVLLTVVHALVRMALYLDICKELAIRHSTLEEYKYLSEDINYTLKRKKSGWPLDAVQAELQKREARLEKLTENLPLRALRDIREQIVYAEILESEDGKEEERLLTTGSQM